LERKRASDFPQPVLDLFDGYQHGFVGRREFLERAKRCAVGGMSAAAMLQSLRPNYAWAEQVKKDDPRIRAPLLIRYAGLDERIDAGWPAWEAALKANHVGYEMHMYPGVNHGFHNDTTPRYDEAAATLAWSRTLDFFRKHLGAG